MSLIEDTNNLVLDDSIGTIHPINQVKEHILRTLNSFGFEEVHGPEIESEEFNFDMLNIKKSHPA